jgi:hypothetical protein
MECCGLLYRDYHTKDDDSEDEKVYDDIENKRWVVSHIRNIRLEYKIDCYFVEGFESVLSDTTKDRLQDPPTPQKYSG